MVAALNSSALLFAARLHIQPLFFLSYEALTLVIPQYDLHSLDLQSKSR